VLQSGTKRGISGKNIGGGEKAAKYCINAEGVGGVENRNRRNREAASRRRRETSAAARHRRQTAAPGGGNGGA